MRNIIVTFGILIVLMPFLGFPGIVEDVFFVVAGLCIALVTYYGRDSKESHEIYNKKVVNSVGNNEV